VTDPLGHTTTLTYDSVGNLTSVQDPPGNTSQRIYDAVSRLLSQTDPLGNTTRFSYDLLNRLVGTTDPLNGQTQFTYDPNGNLLTVTDARGHTLTNEYDPMDRLNRRIDPLGKAEMFSYDGNGNLSSTTDRKSQTTTFAYDPLDRRTQTTHPDGAVASFTYDVSSRLTQADDTTDPHRPITMTYDAVDRLLAETTSLGTVSYTYDVLGRRTQMTVSGQPAVTYAYDPNSRLTGVVQNGQTASLAYDPLGRRTALVLPNQVSTEYQYDPASRLTALIYRNAGGFLGDLQYSYDATGNRTGAGGAFARMLLPDAVTSSVYDAANRQFGFGVSAMTFDDNGNLATQTDPSGTLTYTWDARNRLTGIGGPSTGASFAYDALGRRARKTINWQSTGFQYDRLDVALEMGASDAVAYLRTLAIDEALTRTDSTGTVTYLADALGSTVALTDQTGTTATSYTYAPFGETAITGTPTNSVQFTGRESDGTELYYYRARYYDPTRSRFLAEDPLAIRIRLAALVNHIDNYDEEVSLTSNLYEYTGGNPVTRTDPFGLDWICENQRGIEAPYFLLGSLGGDGTLTAFPRQGKRSGRSASRTPAAEDSCDRGWREE